MACPPPCSPTWRGARVLYGDPIAVGRCGVGFLSLPPLPFGRTQPPAYDNDRLVPATVETRPFVNGVPRLEFYRRAQDLGTYVAYGAVLMLRCAVAFGIGPTRYYYLAFDPGAVEAPTEQPGSFHYYWEEAAAPPSAGKFFFVLRAAPAGAKSAGDLLRQGDAITLWTSAPYSSDIDLMCLTETSGTLCSTQPCLRDYTCGVLNGQYGNYVALAARVTNPYLTPPVTLPVEVPYAGPESNATLTVYAVSFVEPTGRALHVFEPRLFCEPPASADPPPPDPPNRPLVAAILLALILALLAVVGAVVVGMNR